MGLGWKRIRIVSDRAIKNGLRFGQRMLLRAKDMGNVADAEAAIHAILGGKPSSRETPSPAS